MRTTAIEQGHTLAWKSLATLAPWSTVCHFPGSRSRVCSHFLLFWLPLAWCGFCPSPLACPVNYFVDNKEPNLGDLKWQKWTIPQSRAPASVLVGRAELCLPFCHFCQLIFSTTGLNLEMATPVSSFTVAHCLPPACMSVQTSLFI